MAKREVAKTKSENLSSNAKRSLPSLRKVSSRSLPLSYRGWSAPVRAKPCETQSLTESLSLTGFFVFSIYSIKVSQCTRLHFVSHYNDIYIISSRTHVRLGAWFWSAKADIFFSESLHIPAERLSQSEIVLPLRKTCYYSPLAEVGVSTQTEMNVWSKDIFWIGSKNGMAKIVNYFLVRKHSCSHILNVNRGVFLVEK